MKATWGPNRGLESTSQEMETVKWEVKIGEKTSHSRKKDKETKMIKGKINVEDRERRANIGANC